MRFLKQSIVLCAVLVLFSYIKSFFELKLPVVVGGYHHPAFQRVADKFRDNVENSKERGGAFAVYHKGRLVVDLWGGYADHAAIRPWQKDTMTMGFSSTKGVAAVIVATMVDKGYLDYKRPVADYWPQFAQNEKGNITVEMLLSHQGGLPVLDEPISFQDLRDNIEKVEQNLAAQKTVWPAGSAQGYHTLTYGPYVDTLIRKADPKGRNTAEVFYEDIAKPFGLEMYMNAPRDQYYRVARIHEDSPWMNLVKALFIPKYRSMYANVMLNPGSIFSRSAQAMVEFSQGSAVHNNPYLRDITQSCCYGTGTARGFAKLYGIVGNDGSDGKQRLLSQQAIRTLATPLVSGIDVNLLVNMTRGPGADHGTNPRGQLTIGHCGHGGQNAKVDLENHLGIAYLTNYLSMYSFGDDPRFLDLEEALYQSLDDYIIQEGLS